MAEKQAGRLHHKARNLRQEAADKTYDAHRDLVEALFDLRALDPAMGSGHFLVEAVDFITDRLLTFLNQFPVNPVTFMLDRTRRNILEALGERGVAVDPDKLTEVNLLKRHVLKRCIYGVDLNPMAVELAKVSLWLDAFTIGAPLSFLDHHLRCGNSLIGATFKDLEAATKGQLFSIDYERLVRAIRHVIQVNQMADATAAEVKQSAGEYTAARSDLLGYQIVLDLLVAQHFGMPDAPEVLRMGADLDLSSREQFAASVAALGVGNAEKRKREKKKDLSPTLVADVEALARRPDLDFFHWEIEFPEVFFGFEDAEQRRIRHKNEMVAGTAGFDAVVGNPPYVRVELAEKDCKSYLKAHYRTVVDRCDIYVAFIELAMRALRSDGLAGLIVSNQFFNTDYGKNTRELFSEKRSLRNLVDISPLQIFGGALTYPAVLIFALQPQETIRVLAMERFASSTAATLRHDTIFAAYSSRHTEVASHDLYCRDVWNASAICDSGTRDLEDAAGLVPLGSICNISSSMKSGRDDVLVGRIVRETADQFEIEIPIRESPLCVSARLWRRVIRPRDIEVEGRLTNSPSRVVFWPYRDLPDDSFDLMGESELRSICKTTFAHIQQHRELLENRRDSGKTWKQHGRPWYTLGRIGKPSDYEPVKLLSPGEFKTPRFAVSNDRSLFPCARIIGISRIKVAPLALKVFLESGVAADWFRANLAPKGGGFRGMSVGNLSKLPTPRTTDLIWQELAEATGQQAVEEVIANWLAKSHS
jgi:hypothetical protein